MDTSKLVPLAITLVAAWAAYHFGNHIVKGMALGVAGVTLLNQIPVVKSGVNAPILSAAA
jgi:hypothetical protein